MKILKEGLQLIFYSLLFFLFVVLLALFYVLVDVYPILGVIILSVFGGVALYIRKKFSDI